MSLLPLTSEWYQEYKFMDSIKFTVFTYNSKFLTIHIITFCDVTMRGMTELLTTCNHIPRRRVTLW